ncbi:hypothetical protein F5Y05DRAFT_308671 [Hypoxylon sp. FL0543]|nr:hypothetical protein F5Y05DRAFT_308671 [Hypoxylon sp. FL0543]
MTPHNPSPDGMVERLRLPGFGLPVDYEPPDKLAYCFFHALWDFRCFLSDGLKLREIRMMNFINQITDKPKWEEKVFDETIVARWREEAKSAPSEGLDEDVFFSGEMFEYCIRELRDKAEKAKVTGIVNVLDAELAVAKSDTVVPSSLVDALKAGVKVLEDVPDSEKDWHPLSGEKVLDLVHPSLFPLVYGTTRVLPYGKVPLENCASFIGRGEATTVFEVAPADGPALWGSNQWLPSDIEWSENGPRITSYINNLHPADHGDLYNVLEQFVAASVPLWEECLFRPSEKQTMRITRRSGGNEDFHLLEGFKYAIPDEYIHRDSDNEDGEEIDEEYMYTDDYIQWFDQHKVLDWPEPDEYFPRERDPDSKPDLKTEFPSGLQVIFKLANILLTPEAPEYGGGTWHIEGALNDRIVATALYYYDVENISESRLAFRQAVDAEEMRLQPPQHEWESLARWHGIADDDLPFQEVGDVLTRAGRLIAFPNVFQHQVQPFRLEDPLRPGHRKILAMFLVDPNIRVLSTGVVPPQRKDWWAREVRKIRPFSHIPMEILDLIVDFVEDFPMSWERAEAVRERLIQERSWSNEIWESEIGDYPYSFCEH